MKVFIFICTQTTLGFASISGHFRPPAEGESSALSLSRLGQSLGPESNQPLEKIDIYILHFIHSVPQLNYTSFRRHNQENVVATLNIESKGFRSPSLCGVERITLSPWRFSKVSPRTFCSRLSWRRIVSTLLPRFTKALVLILRRPQLERSSFLRWRSGGNWMAVRLWIWLWARDSVLNRSLPSKSLAGSLEMLFFSRLISLSIFSWEKAFSSSRWILQSFSEIFCRWSKPTELKASFDNSLM